MAYLGIPQNTIAVLQKYHFNFQKKFGQNFLIDTTVEFSFVFFFLNRVSFVVQLFAPCDAEFDLYERVLEIKFRGDKGISLLFHLLFQFSYFRLMQQ